MKYDDEIEFPEGDYIPGINLFDLMFIIPNRISVFYVNLPFNQKKP